MILSQKKYSQKNLFILLALFLTSILSYSQTNFYTGSLDQSSWDGLNTQINTKKATLTGKITLLTNAGLETSYADGTLVTVNEFVVYAARDRANATALQSKYTGTGYTGFNNAFTNQLPKEGLTSGTNYSTFGPFQILNDCVKILDNAIAEADKQINGTIIIPPIFDYSTSTYPEYSAASSYYKKDGKVIYPSTMWSMQSETDLMKTLGFLGSSFLSPQTTNSPNATFTPFQLSSQVSLVSTSVSNKQTPIQVQITHTPLASWMTTVSNDITSENYKIADYKRAFVAYDIDYPMFSDTNSSSNWNKTMLNSYIPSIKTAAGSAPLIYVLSNEPHWDLISTAVNTTQAASEDAAKGLSPHTRTAFAEYLKVEYGNNIANLNAVYNPFNGNTNFTTFDQLKTQPSQSSTLVPLALFTEIQKTSLQGTPIWYDWLRFNQNRATNWHLKLKQYTLESDPTAKVSVKIIGNEVEAPDRDSGIDLEASGDFMDVISFDSQITPSSTHGRNARFYRDWWLGRYITEWREQAINIDFFKSLYPNKPIFDSEWHGISSNAWYNFVLDKGFVRSGLWHGFSTGLGVVNAWWWYREDGTNNTIKGDLESKTGTVGNTMSSPQHQPIAFEDFGKTMKEINSLSETVATLAPTKRDFLIYYCNEAAIQDFTYIQQLGQIYEALKLLNVKVGFTTASKINSLGYTPKAIIFPPTLYIKSSSIDAINTYKSNNSTVDILEIKRTSTTNFVKDEKGTPNTSRNISFPTKSFTYNGAFTYLSSTATPTTAQITTNSTNANAILTTLITSLRANLTIPVPPIDFKIQVVSSTTETFGVLAAQGNTPNGKAAVSLINLSLTDKQIKLPASSTPYVNMIDGTTVAETFVMKPYDVLLVTTKTKPTFDQVSTICSGATLAALPTTSNESITGTWSPAVNNTATTTYTFTPTAGQYATTATMTIVVGETTTWNGSTWSNGAPTSIMGAIISGNWVATTNLTACSLTVKNGAQVLVKSGFTFDIYNVVAVEAGSSLTFENNANLIQTSKVANTGAITVNRNSSALLRLDYTLWSSPVASQNLSTFSPATATNRFYTYNSSTNFYNSVVPSSTNFATGSGYLIRMPNTASDSTPTVYPGLFIGVPNNGDVPVTLANNGVGLRFNAVGNPYPSPISMTQFLADNSDNITSSLYFWRKTNAALGAAYCTWNNGTFVTNHQAQVFNPSGIIQTGQGFFVEAKNSSTGLTFNNGQRVNDHQNQFFKTKQVVENNRIWLNAIATTGEFAQMAINYVTGAVQGLDPFDAKYFNDGTLALNSVIDNTDYVIQGRALPFDGTDEVPLSFRNTTAGTYSIAIDHVDGLFAGSQDIILKDNVIGTETNLKAGAYAFEAQAGASNSRFVLKYQKTLSTKIPVFTEDSVIIDTNKGIIHINSGGITMKSVQLFDTSGRLVFKKDNVNKTETSIDASKFAKQVFVVKITSVENKEVSKKAVN